MTRLTADFFVSALLRSVFADGGMGAVEKRGATEAGAVHIRVRHADGGETLLTPAPQALFDDERPDTRIFEPRLSRADAGAVDAILARERDFDPDIWIVEIETDQPEKYVVVTGAD